MSRDEPVKEIDVDSPLLAFVNSAREQKSEPLIVPKTEDENKRGIVKLNLSDMLRAFATLAEVTYEEDKTIFDNAALKMVEKADEIDPACDE